VEHDRKHDQRELMEREYDVEVLYLLNSLLDSASYDSFDRLVRTVLPGVDTTPLAITDEQRARFYDAGRNRLAAAADDDAKSGSSGDRQPHTKYVEQLDREIRAQSCLRHILSEARRAGDVESAFRRLASSESGTTRICSATPGRGLLVYVRIRAGFSELEHFTDRGVQFGVPFALGVVATARHGVPAIADRVRSFGPSADGRCVIRVVEAVR